MTHQTTIPARVISRLPTIRARLIAERVRDLRDAELTRALGPCVCGPQLIHWAKALRDMGELSAAEIAAVQFGRARMEYRSLYTNRHHAARFPAEYAQHRAQMDALRRHMAELTAAYGDAPEFKTATRHA